MSAGKVELLLAILDAEVTVLRTSAAEIRRGISCGVLLASAEPIAMIQTVQADSLRRIIDAFDAAPNPARGVRAGGGR